MFDVLTDGKIMSVASLPATSPLAEDELRRKIGLLVVPGTIDAIVVPGSRRRPGMVASARVPAEEMAATVKRLAALPDLCVLPGPDRLSHDLSPGDWLTISRQIQDVLDRNVVDGVVVTHGTNSLEEIAYFLSLTVASPKPVVVTGAMLPWGVVGSDGILNLIDAVLVAASNRSQSRRVMVSFGRDIFNPRHATKCRPMHGRRLQRRGRAPSDGSMTTARLGISQTPSVLRPARPLTLAPYSPCRGSMWSPPTLAPTEQ